MSKRLLVIGIGAGNPEHVTVQAVHAMNTVDVFFVIDKSASPAPGAEALVRLRREICERYIVGHPYRFVEIVDPQRDRTPAAYAQEVTAWHHQRAQLFSTAIADELGPDGVGAFLVWGDPSLYDSTLRIVEQIVDSHRRSSGVDPFDYAVIPGITSVQALAASHRTVLHGIGESVEITTGRRVSAGIAEDVANTVVMLDSGTSFAGLDQHAFDIIWGAYLGTPDEVLVSGHLADVGDRIAALRRELRDRHGWIMDIYLLRRVGAGADVAGADVDRSLDEARG